MWANTFYLYAHVLLIALGVGKKGRCLLQRPRIRKSCCQAMFLLTHRSLADYCHACIIEHIWLEKNLDEWKIDFSIWSQDIHRNKFLAKYQNEKELLKRDLELSIGSKSQCAYCNNSNRSGGGSSVMAEVTAAHALVEYFLSARDRVLY